MFILGHLGLGYAVSQPFLKTKPWNRYFFLGCLFPDLLDKSIYYSYSWFVGKVGVELGLISGGRLFGHTILFVVICLGLGVRYNWLASFAIGVASHLLLDQVADAIGQSFSSGMWEPGVSRRIQSLCWPFFGNYFLISPHSDGRSHFLSLFSKPHLLVCEGLGGLVLIRELIKSRVLTIFRK